MLNLRLVIFFVVYFWHNQIQYAAMSIILPQCPSVIINANPIIIPAPTTTTLSATPSMNSINYINATVLSQINDHKIRSFSSDANNGSHLSTKMPMSRYQESLVKEKAQTCLQTDHLEILKKERALIRIEKEILLKSEVICPTQEKLIFLAKLKKLKIEEHDTELSCNEIQSLLALAIATSNTNLKNNLNFLINNHMNCDQLPDQKDTSKNEPSLFKNNNSKNQNSHKNQGKNYSNFIKSDRTARLDDVMHEGVQYKQYVFVDDNNQYSAGYLVSHDGKHGVLFNFVKPMPIQPSRTFQSIQQFHRYHEGSVPQMKMNCLKQSPVIQRRQVDQSYLKGRITAEQAIQHYQEIEYAKNLADARAAVKQFEKAQKAMPHKTANNKTTSTNTTRTSIPPTSTQPTPSTNNTSTQPSVQTPAQNQTSSTAPTSAQTPTPTRPINPASSSTNTVTMSEAEQALLANITRNSLPIPTNSPSGNNENMTPQHLEQPEKTITQNQRQELLEAQDTWMQNTNTSNADPKDFNKIQHMLNVIVETKNDMTIEIAQSGLRAWQQAQDAETKESRKHNLKFFQLCHNAIQHKTPIKSIAQQAESIKSIELDNLLQNYKAAIKMHGEEQSSNQNQTTKNPHFDRLEKRAQALSSSKEQLRAYKALPQRNYEVSPQARGFMMANNMNYAAFDGKLPLTDYQHCLTQEILGIIESSAEMAQIHDTQSMIGKIVHYNCHLAISAQQLNQTSHIEQATAITDFSHFFDAYAQLLHDSTLYHPSFINIHVGIMEGTAQALWSWKTFITDLTCHPIQTIGKIGQDCQAIGTCLYNVAAKAHEFMPDAYFNDMMQNMQQNIANIQNNQNHASFDSQSKMMQRTQRNAQYLQDGVCGSLQAAQSIIAEIMKKTWRQNTAAGTEIIIDNLIAGKATDYLLKLSSLVGTQILQAADQLHNTIPSDLLNSNPIFMTSSTTGELLAIAENTGENIGAAVAAKKIADNAAQIIKNTAQAKILSDKIDQITKPNKEAIAAFEKELKPYLHSDKLIDVERLKSIEGVDPINKYKEYTNNFTNLEKLTPEEILYLNLCDWLEPQARAINAEIKATGGLKFIHPETGAEVIIEKFDLFHSLLGEMKPGNLKDCVNGGHLLITELRAATLELGNIEIFGEGFLDIFIKAKSNKKINSYFPRGTSVQEAVDMVKDSIKNHKKISSRKMKNLSTQGLNFTNQNNQSFGVTLENKIANFFPLKPE